MPTPSLDTTQSLSESWEIVFRRPRIGSPIEARLKTWAHPRQYLVVGQGQTVEEARLDLVERLARAIREDPDLPPHPLRVAVQ